MASACPDGIPPLDPDIAGIGVRISIYAQAAFALISSSALLSLLFKKCPEDRVLAICRRSRNASWILGFFIGAMTLTAYIKMWKNSLSVSNAEILYSYSTIGLVVQLDLILPASLYDHRRLGLSRYKDVLLPLIMSASQAYAGFGLTSEPHVLPPDTTCTGNTTSGISPQILGFGTSALTVILVYYAITVIAAMIPAAITYPVSVMSSWKFFKWIRKDMLGFKKPKVDPRLGVVIVVTAHAMFVTGFCVSLKSVEGSINPIRTGETVWGFGQIVSILMLIPPAARCDGVVSHLENKLSVRAAPSMYIIGCTTLSGAQ